MRDWGEKLFFAEVFELTFLDKDMLIVYKVTCKHHSMCWKPRGTLQKNEFLTGNSEKAGLS